MSMLHPFLSEQLARERLHEVSRRAAEAARIAEASGSPPRANRVRASVGMRLVRVGLRLAGASTAVLREPAGT